MNPSFFCLVSCRIPPRAPTLQSTLAERARGASLRGLDRIGILKALGFTGGQILLVTGGRGYYQEEGKPARLVKAGDVVEILPTVKHWHGAAADSWFVHIGITTNPHAGDAEWLEEVRDEEYAKLGE